MGSFLDTPDNVLLYAFIISEIMASSLMARVMLKQLFAEKSISRFFHATPRIFQDKFEMLSAPPSDTNYFELMEQPKTFAIDTKKLSKRFKQLQIQLHPDRYSTRNEQELKNSEDWSSLVNEAYR